MLFFPDPNRRGVNLKATSAANKKGFPNLLRLFIDSSYLLIVRRHDLVPRTLFHVEESESGQIHLQDALSMPCC